MSECGSGHLKLTVNFLEHAEHVLEVIVVEKPHGFVLVILVERN